jgi:hypothetical protein
MTRARSLRTVRHLLAASLSSGVLLVAAAASASNYTVNGDADTHDASLNDDKCKDTAGKCTLRAAIEQANAHPGWDSITLGSFVHILSIGELVITDDVDLYGVSSGASVLDAAFRSRVLVINDTLQDGAVYMSDLTIRNGVGSPDGGAGIRIAAGDYTGDRVVIYNNESRSTQGGGVAVGDTFVCYDCEISNNRAPSDAGGGVQHTGGGVYFFAGASGYIYYSTIASNSATRGAGIGGGGHLELWNSTVSANVARAGGGGLLTFTTDAQWGVAWTTITGNSCNTGHVSSNEPTLGAGFFHRTGSLEVGRSIVAANIDNRSTGDDNYSPDCGASPTANTILSHWDNLFGNIGHQCYIKSVFGGSIRAVDKYGSGSSTIDPKLGALALAPGSITRTHALLAGSPARNLVTHGNATGWWLMDCPFQDQTYTHARPQGGLCDAGSYEAP